MDHRLPRLGACLIVAIGLVACSDDKDRPAQPGPGVSSFVEGSFDDVPVFRGATVIGGPTDQGGTRSASFEVQTARPETVLRFYDENLPSLGWSPVEPIQETNDRVWRGEWVREGRRLQVVASPLRPDSGDVTDAQLDLVLYDDAAGV